MQLLKAERKQAKIKMAIQGPSGSGKTYSSLLVSKGLTGDLTKVCIIDTENHSAHLYAHMGGYHVISLNTPFTPEKYIKAIELAEAAGMELVILDSISHSWEYLLDYHAGLTGNSFANWSKVTPRHNALVQKILSSPCHIICTLRVKQDYVLSDKNGKMVPEKVGLKTIQRDGLDYEFTVVFDLDIKHHATCSKDRTGLFSEDYACKLSVSTGTRLLEWCQEGITIDQVKEKVISASSVEALTDLFKQYKAYYPLLEKEFLGRKAALTQISVHPKTLSNGITTH